METMQPVAAPWCDITGTVPATWRRGDGTALATCRGYNGPGGA